MERSGSPESPRPKSHYLSDFIREHKREILQDWERALGGIPHPATLDPGTLLSDIPDLLDWIADLTWQLISGGRATATSPLADKRAVARLDEGFDLGQVIAEFAMLRASIVRVSTTAAADDGFDSAEFRAFHEAIDAAIAESADHYIQARDRSPHSVNWAAEEDRSMPVEQAQRGRAEAQAVPAVVDALLSSSLIGFGFLDRNLRYVRMNDALAAINGRSAAEHIGRSVREILGDRADVIEPHLRRMLETGEALTNLELTVAPPSTPDQIRSFLANYFPVRGAGDEMLGIGAAIVEITDRARAQAALRASEQRLQKALSIETVGVLFFSLDGRMLDANRALERMSGYSREELRSINWQVLTPPEFADATARTAEQLATVGEAPPYEKQWIRPDGSRWWGLFAPMRLAGNGRASECVEFIIDISERKRAEEALQSTMRAREEIVAVVSHDLRNPLGAIHMAATLLARKPLPDPRTRKQVETILRSASRMDRLITDLLDMASIQAGHLGVELKPENPESLVEEAIEMHAPVAMAKGVRITRVLDFKGRLLSCDRERVLQIFSNLLGNAIKFCHSEDVITVRGEIGENQARFAVADSGPGISETELPRLFEPYWSGKRHGKKGTGLGLYITKGIIEAHGGRLSVESKPGEGATFSFTLPLASEHMVST